MELDLSYIIRKVGGRRLRKGRRRWGEDLEKEEERIRKERKRKRRRKKDNGG